MSRHGRQDDDREDRDGYRVPVEQAYVAANLKIGEKRHGEIAMRIERNAARQVACSGAKEGGQQKT
jgi:hypothetical protein